MSTSALHMHLHTHTHTLMCTHTHVNMDMQSTHMYLHHAYTQMHTKIQHVVILPTVPDKETVISISYLLSTSPSPSLCLSEFSPFLFYRLKIQQF